MGHFMLEAGGLAYLKLAGNDRMKKNMEATETPDDWDPEGTAIRIPSSLPC